MFYIIVFGQTYYFRRERQADWAAEQAFLLSGFRPEVYFDKSAA